MSFFFWLIVIYLISRWGWRRYKKTLPTTASTPLEEAARRVLGAQTGDFVVDKIRGPLAVRNIILAGFLGLLGVSGVLSSVGFLMGAIMAPASSLYMLFPGLMLLFGGLWLLNITKKMWAEAIGDIKRDFPGTPEKPSARPETLALPQPKPKARAQAHATSKSSMSGTLHAANSPHKQQPHKKSKESQFREL